MIFSFMFCSFHPSFGSASGSRITSLIAVTAQEIRLVSATNVSKRAVRGNMLNQRTDSMS